MTDSKKGFVQWFLVNGNRHVVAGVLVLSLFFLLATLGYAGIIRIGDQEAVRGIAGGFIPGLIAFLSIVLAINQLVLSQELGTAGEIQARIEAVRNYRQAVEEIADDAPSPVLPTGFIAFVVQTIEVEADALRNSVGPETDPDIRETIETYAQHISAESSQVSELLEQARPGRINALLPVLEYNDSHQLIKARRLRHETEAQLSEETRDALDGVIEALKLFSVARIQFRSTYTQRVLSRLSRQLLYVGLPAIVAVLILGLLNMSHTSLTSGEIRVVINSALFSAALTPLAVLSAYLVRVAIVSERTIAVGPFVSRPKVAETGRTSEFPASEERPPQSK